MLERQPTDVSSHRARCNVQTSDAAHNEVYYA
jgi:hypothetical protein